MDDVGRCGVLPGETMTEKENRHGSTSARPPAHEIRATATYQRDGKTALTKTHFFDGTTTLEDLLTWAREAEDLGVVLAGLEIDVQDPPTS